MQKEKLLFLTLNTFSSTGGIEKVCRVAGKALFQIAAEETLDMRLYSLNDQQSQLDEKYLSAENFSGFAGRKKKFIKAAIATGRQSKIVVLSHVHLLLIAVAIKLVSPKTKIVLIAHGIEVWKPFPKWKIAMLKMVDLFLPVSEFTMQKMLSLYKLDTKQVLVVNNCLDPFLQRDCNSPKMAFDFRKKYGIGPKDIIILTLSRLQFSEQYKGYDKVIQALPEVLKKHSQVKYLIAGKYDEQEKRRLDVLINSLNLNEKVIFTGFLPDEEMGTCFETAVLYAMPSTGEGFGIVFVEAMFYGKPVIAGNVDGSVDALANGELGFLVNPQNKQEIVSAILKILERPNAFVPEAVSVTEKFGFSTYVSNLKKALSL